MISQFRLLTPQYSHYEDGGALDQQSKPNYISANGQDGYYPKFPMIIEGNGEPWRMANLYLTAKLHRESGYESRTFRGIADHLLDYLRFLEDENLDYLYFPRNTRLRVTFLYHKHLAHLCALGELAKNTASARMNTVVNFYRSIMDWKLIKQHEIENSPFENINKTINVVSATGTESTVKVKSHNLAFKAPRADIPAEYIRDGGILRPLLLNEQISVLKALLMSSREYQLMFYLALFTGARAQTVGTIRLKNLLGPLDGTGYLRLPTGSGTLIDTKRGKQLTLLVPGWLVKDMITYSQSDEAIKRRGRSYYGETGENYLFLSKNGVPYYTSKRELYDRRDSAISSNTSLTDRATNASIQDGAAIRQHIKEILQPRILTENPNFQEFTFHDLRATFGMNLLESQMQHQGDRSISSAIDYVQQRMGHSDKLTTMQYLNYKSRLEWKFQIQNNFEEYLFSYLNMGAQ
ncbi:tyrosine-type recombinase/integrase [Pseudomonas sp. NPDC086566]|uniref:tyrosine-type recombinase/integrase n=1 Tax=Pseudomonas sp. NPDC086566 TaxID=3390647 RepID=UPI003CFE6FA2